ncbi:MAG: glycosyl hydrolase [Vulcanimicrobiota bacterium]
MSLGCGRPVPATSPASTPASAPASAPSLVTHLPGQQPVPETPTPSASVDELQLAIKAFEPPPSAVVASTTASRPQQLFPDSVSNLPLKLPSELQLRAITDVELDSLRALALASQSAADWRKVAERALLLEDFGSAQEAFQRESDIYRAKGHTQAALAEAIKAAQYSTKLQLYRSIPPEPAAKLERLEPASGCYLGAFIDRDDALQAHQFGSQIHGDIEQFNELVEKPHASFFMYRAYGTDFPTRWAEYCKENGAIVHIAWEPKNLEEVKEDHYLEKFMAEAARLDHPVLLRFASEMNGKWTPYNGDPEAYKQAFRLVHKASRNAPKVALMWCPNTVPQAEIQDYYPGHEYVDWVGVNFYSVPYLDNDPERSGELIHPTDHLKFVYDTYSVSKPIAIGEWAASRESSLSPDDLTDFAGGKLAQLYSDLPTAFPRVKMVNWYNCNNIVKARQERQLNNFQLTTSKPLLERYRRAIEGPYFLGAGAQASPVGFEVARSAVALSPGDILKVSLKSYDPLLKVYFLLEDQVIHASSDPLEWYVSGRQLGTGAESVTIAVFDSRDWFVTSETIRVER